ncbi:sensor histidine kinase [Pseudonocardia spinosispora]|uniref:sensor histidine kinase n=1 Tax=Pseudonocardia spinosispora TaxID=103441 RepID=UPI000406737D|nr:histidine kinase [Pseudonocardia spinosispora]
MTRTGDRPPLRRVWVIVELLVLVGLNVESGVHRLFLEGAPGAGGIAYLAVGTAAGVFALARHWFPERIATLAASAIALSLGTSLVGYLVAPAATLSGDPEVLALMLLVGAGCHRLPRRLACGAVVLGGLAIAAAPVLRYGTGANPITVAVVWAVLWGCSVTVGLILRDGDARRDAALVAARNRERLALARELHDLVAHHITGVVVRTQAAGLILGEGPEHDLIQEIEHSGAEALAAVRRLVMMLRLDQATAVSMGGLTDAVEAAVDGDDAVSLRLEPRLEDLSIAPETVSTVHRVVLESLTNVRKHAPDAHHVVVTVRPVTAAARRLMVEVINDGHRRGRGRSAGGYGLLGMSERIAALDGTLIWGEHGESSWRVLVELPLPSGVVATRSSEGGIEP